MDAIEYHGPRVADLPIRHVRTLEPREFTEWRVGQFPDQWRTDTEPTYLWDQALGAPRLYTITDALFRINDALSLVPRLHSKWCSCERCSPQSPVDDVPF